MNQHPHVNPRVSFTLTASFLTMLGLAVAPAQAQSDNFNDGNDTDWTHYSPLAPFGAGGAYSFPGGAYRIDAPASPNDQALGPGRAGAYRADASYTDFKVSVEVTAWSTSDDQFIAVVARASQVGLGTTDGYMFGYFPNASLSTPGLGGISIQRLDNEGIGASSGELVTLDPAKSYRFDFYGSGSALFGAVYDLSNPETPLATTTQSDSTYAAGYSGLLVSGAANVAGSKGGATFDNYVASVPEPSTVALLVLGAGGLCWSLRRRN